MPYRLVKRFFPAAVLLCCTMLTGLPAALPQARANAVTQAELPHWRGCVSGMIAGKNRCTVVYIGDSTVQSANNNTYGDTQQNVTYWLASQLAANGIRAEQNGFCGSGGSTSRFFTDTRISQGVWKASGQTGLGGQVISTAVETGAPLVFTPGVAVNTYAMTWYSSGNSTGSFTATPRGGTPVTETNTKLKALQTVLLTSPALSAANALALSPASANSNMFVSCVLAYDSTHTAVDIYNAGDYGANTDAWVSSAAPDSPIPTLKFLAPTLTIIESGINDPTVPVPLSTFTSNLQTIITAGQASGDVVLVTGNNALNHASGPYFNAIRQLAATDNLPVLSVDQLLVSPQVDLDTTPPLIGPDEIHPTAAGALYIAHALVQLLLN
jgi:hypothetical protein